MFKSKNFCHIASNNRNQVKVGVFTYRTTDSLATVLVNGYFNERIIDINLHDLIIHEKIDALDNTKVVRNLLCVTERTLENVGTSVVKSDWEGDIEQAIEDLRTYVNNNFVKIDGMSVMTGPLKMRATPDFKCAVAPCWDGVGFFKLNDNNSVTLMASLEYEDGLTPATDNKYNLGTTTKRWKDARIARVITGVVNNGYDIAVPVTNSTDTLALKSEVDAAANSGDQLYSTGVWYAKMYAATVVPTGAEYDGRNYADFSQVDSDNNPIIVIYTGASGAWTETTRITPPTAYNGYMTITSKIWDIAEQSGQQGGKVLWSHNQKTFTPYPQIISFENAALTGVPTAPLPTNASPNNQIATKEYVDNATPSGGYHPDIFSWQWADHQLDDVQWLRADTFSWQSGAVYEAGYNHLVDDLENIPQQEWAVSTQNANLSANNPDWNGIAYNGSKFVALSLIGEISTSTDGTTWTTASQNSNLGNNYWQQMASNGTKFVALGSSGHISTSTDGTTWTIATQNANLHSVDFWYGLVFDGTKFIALNAYGYISTSTDGTTWTTPVQNANLGSNSWRQISYNGSKFVALGLRGYVSTSVDGTNWTVAVQNADLGNAYEWLGLASNEREFIATSYDGYISKSVDGVNWTPAAIDTNLGNHHWVAIVNDNSKFIVLAWYGWISTKSNDCQTETIAGITITYYTAADGHKIVLPNQEANVSSIYSTTGVAWYYILDTANQRFKLPRTKYGFTGLRDTVGKYVPESLPNITGIVDTGTRNTHVSGAFQSAGSESGSGANAHAVYWASFDASRSSSAYQTDAPVQQRATQMYLYFYVGQFTQTALENTAGITAEVLNDKVDKGHQVVEFQAPTADNNYTWYRKYADGWVEQGGFCSGTVGVYTVNLPVEMANGNYSTVGTYTDPSAVNNTTVYTVRFFARNTNSFTCDLIYYNGNNRTRTSEQFSWQVSGMVA